MNSALALDKFQHNRRCLLRYGALKVFEIIEFNILETGYNRSERLAEFGLPGS